MTSLSVVMCGPFCKHGSESFTVFALNMNDSCHFCTNKIVIYTYCKLYWYWTLHKLSEQKKSLEFVCLMVCLRKCCAFVTRTKASFERMAAVLVWIMRQRLRSGYGNARNARDHEKTINPILGL